MDDDLWSAGYDMAFGATPEIREAARQRWIELKAARLEDG